MRIEGWFPTPVGFEDLPEAEDLHAYVGPTLRAIAERQGNPQPQVLGRATTGANAPDATQYLFLLEPLRPLFDAIMKRVGPFLEAQGIDLERERAYLGRAWVNLLERGARIDRHHHASALASGVYYVDAPPDGTSLRFLDPRAPLLRDPLLARPSPYTQRTVDYPVRPGRLILFPGWLEHGMPAPHDDDSPRLSVAFDIYTASLSGMSPPPTPPDVAGPMWDALRAHAAALVAGLPQPTAARPRAIG